MGLAGVLDDVEVSLPRQRAESLHVGQAAVQVHRHERARPRADRRRRRRRIHPVVGLRDVHRNGNPARLGHGLEGRDEGHGRHDDLLAGAEPNADEREPERIEPACNPDAVSRAAVRGERLLERDHRRAVRERARAKEP